MVYPDRNTLQWEQLEKEKETTMVTLVDVPGYTGLVLAFVLMAVAVCLLMRGDLRIQYRLVLLAIITIAALFLLAPMTPIMFMVLVYRVPGSAVPFLAALLAVILVFASTLVFGRVFCGYGCPLGAVQELPYFIPVRKVVLKQNPILLVLRGVLITLLCLAAFFFAAKYLMSSMVLLRGARTLFVSPELTLPLVLFLAVIALSAFLYRPFCRYACPLGALLSLAAWAGRFSLRKGKACTRCGKCQAACPTGEMAQGRRGNECYLCGRCLDSCPVEGALAYARRPGL